MALSRPPIAIWSVHARFNRDGLKAGLHFSLKELPAADRTCQISRSSRAETAVRSRREGGHIGGCQHRYCRTDPISGERVIPEVWKGILPNPLVIALLQRRS